jgi:hypothetical protein
MQRLINAETHQCRDSSLQRLIDEETHRCGDSSMQRLIDEETRLCRDWYTSKGGGDLYKKTCIKRNSSTVNFDCSIRITIVYESPHGNSYTVSKQQDPL